MAKIILIFIIFFLFPRTQLAWAEGDNIVELFLLGELKDQGFSSVVLSAISKPKLQHSPKGRMRSNCHRTISRCLVEVIQEESIIYYWFSVSAKARAFVPKYTLNGGARVEPKMFESKLVNIFVCDSVASLEQIANQRLVRKVSKNKALCLEDLEPAPVFVKGEEAVLIYNNGGFDIFVSVIVMDDVFIGNYAHVRIPGSGKSLRARLEKDKQFYMGNYK